MKKIELLIALLVFCLAFVSCDESDKIPPSSMTQETLQEETEKYYEGTEIETFESITEIPLTIRSEDGKVYHYYCGTSNTVANTKFLIYATYLNEQCGFEYATDKEYLKQGLAEFKTPNGKIALLYGKFAAKDFGTPEDGFGVVVGFLDD